MRSETLCAKSFKHGANTLRICLLIDGLDENQEGRCEQQRGHQALVRYLQSLAYGATYPSCYIKTILARKAFSGKDSRKDRVLPSMTTPKMQFIDMPAGMSSLITVTHYWNSVVY